MTRISILAVRICVVEREMKNQTFFEDVGEVIRVLWKCLKGNSDHDKSVHILRVP
jgi:hypothetical protein